MDDSQLQQSLGDWEMPWRNEDVLRHYYLDEMMSQTSIAEMWDCSQSTVGTWLDKHGIEKRTPREAILLSYGSLYSVPFHTDADGVEVWYHSYGEEKCMVQVHRLVAVAKFGFEAVKDKVVHHESEIRWDNRPGNLSLMTHSEHSAHHRSLSWLDRLRVVEMYEHGDIGSRPLGAMFGTSFATVLREHKMLMKGEAA